MLRCNASIPAVVTPTAGDPAGPGEQTARCNGLGAYRAASGCGLACIPTATRFVVTATATNPIAVVR